MEEHLTITSVHFLASFLLHPKVGGKEFLISGFIYLAKKPVQDSFSLLLRQSNKVLVQV